MKYVNHSPEKGCFCYPDLGAISDVDGYNIYQITSTGEDKKKKSGGETDFVELRETMDHYFYRMTSKVTDEEVTSFMCSKGKRRTGMAFMTSPWVNEIGLTMNPKWYLLSCRTFTAGEYVGGAENSVNVVTHYYFDQPEPKTEEETEEEWEEAGKKVIPIALDYDPLPFIFASKHEEMPESDTRNYVLVNRTSTNHQRFRFQASKDLSQLQVKMHEMYHDYGAKKWHIDSPESFVNFTKKANITMLWKSESQDIGYQVVGNDFSDDSLVGVKGESEMNVHIDYIVTKRIIGIPAEWRNQTQFRIILQE